MDKETKVEIVKCISEDIHPLFVMRNQISVKTIQSLLTLMGTDYTEGLPSDAYLMAWYEEFSQNREWILLMLPKPHLQLLLEIWDSPRVSMDSVRWEMVRHLAMFGFLTYKKGSARNHTESRISVIRSMKKNFYFLLKSRRSGDLMDRYERWENALMGMSFYYGIISLDELHALLCEALKEEIVYGTFLRFIKCRAGLWGLGSFPKDRKKKEYFMSGTVESAELTLLLINDHPDLPYRRISYPDLSYVRAGYGIDNRWPGVSELGLFLIEDMDQSYYRSTVMVHSILTAIQNGATLDKILGKLDFITFFAEEEKRTAEEYVMTMYESVPLYELKGHSRWEYRKMAEKQEWVYKKRKFTLLTGGRAET